MSLSFSASQQGVLANAMAPPALFAGLGGAPIEDAAAGVMPVHGSAETQHQLSILFSDLSSSVDFAAELNWQAYLGLMRRLRELFRATVSCHGGTIARIQGDGMLAIFGQSGSAGDDGYHAIRCALDLHRAVGGISLEALGQGWAALHSGIYSGLTYVESGDMERGRYDLVGSAPSLASRLSGLAGRDGILVGEQVIAPRLDDFEVSERLTLSVRGWPKPLRAYHVLGLSRRGLHPQKWG